MNTVIFWHETAYPSHPGPRLVRKYLKQILTDYPTTPAAKKAREFQEKLDAPAKRFASLKAPATKTGSFSLAFTETHPLASDAEVERRSKGDFLFDMVPDGEFDRYDIIEESFDVYVPPSYKLGRSYGLLVWLGLHRLPTSYEQILARHDLVIIAPHEGRATKAVYHQALDAVHNICKVYDIDRKRTYVAGLQYGAAQAGSILRAYPDVFTGALAIDDPEFYRTYRDPESGKILATVESPPWEGDLAAIKSSTSIVIVAGRRNGSAHANFDALELDGFVRAGLVNYEHAPKKQFPLAGQFDRALSLLVDPKVGKPPATAPMRKAHPLAGQIAQAQRLLASGHYYGDAKLAPHQDRWTHQWSQPVNPHLDVAKARLYLEQLIEEYPTTTAAREGRELLVTLSDRR